MNANQDERLNEIVAAYFRAKERGEPFDRTTILAANQDLATDLDSFFEAQAQVEAALRSRKRLYQSEIRKMESPPISLPSVGVDVDGMAESAESTTGLSGNLDPCNLRNFTGPRWFDIL